MSRRLSKKDIVTLSQRAHMDPSKEFESNLMRELETSGNSEKFGDYAETGKRTFSKAGYVIAAILIAVGIGVGVMHLTPTKVAVADGYSYDAYDTNKGIEVGPDFFKNKEESLRIFDNFYREIPYSTKYPSADATGTYTVDSYPANAFPDYYAGSYINVDGQLIVMIKANYYSEDYRSSDWYKELANKMESENFRCRPAKYNYTELINGMSDVHFGELKQRFVEAGVEVYGYELNDYRNEISIIVNTEGEAQKVQSILSSDMYVTRVLETVPRDEMIVTSQFAAAVKSDGSVSLQILSENGKWSDQMRKEVDEWTEIEYLVDGGDSLIGVDRDGELHFSPKEWYEQAEMSDEISVYLGEQKEWESFMKNLRVCAGSIYYPVGGIIVTKDRNLYVNPWVGTKEPVATGVIQLDSHSGVYLSVDGTVHSIDYSFDEWLREQCEKFGEVKTFGIYEKNLYVVCKNGSVHTTGILKEVEAWKDIRELHVSRTFVVGLLENGEVRIASAVTDRMSEEHSVSEWQKVVKIGVSPNGDVIAGVTESGEILISK